MYTNETILTPLFRYDLWCIEKNGSKDYDKAYDEINNLAKRLRADDALNNILGDHVEDSVQERVLELLKYGGDGADTMRAFWQRECEVIGKEECKKCVSCRKCRLYFWMELGELLFNEPNIMKQKGSYVPVRRLPDDIKKALTPSKQAADLYYNRYINRKVKPVDGGIILKGMSSSTPSLMNSLYDTSQYSGGGFFIKYHGVGIAIDPGYHFLDNLHHYGLSVLDIQAVVVTHEHIDHNNDMRLLDELHHAVYKYIKEGVNKKIHWYLDKVSYEVARVYQENGTGFFEESNILHLISGDIAEREENGIWVSKDIPVADNEDIKLRCFMTKHIESKAAEGFQTHTYGCQFAFEEGTETHILVYTSDTSYFQELARVVNKPEVLIANISGVYEDDMMLVKPKKRHLGYYGCYHLLKDLWNQNSGYPRLVLLSEFWNGENDIRYDVAEYLEEQLRQQHTDTLMRVVPAEVGMSFRVTDCAVRCSQCGKYTSRFFVRKPNGYKEKIRIVCKSCVY